MSQQLPDDLTRRTEHSISNSQAAAIDLDQYIEAEWVCTALDPALGGCRNDELQSGSTCIPCCARAWVFPMSFSGIISRSEICEADR